MSDSQQLTMGNHMILSMCTGHTSGLCNAASAQRSLRVADGAKDGQSPLYGRAKVMKSAGIMFEHLPPQYLAIQQHHVYSTLRRWDLTCSLDAWLWSSWATISLCQNII